MKAWETFLAQLEESLGSDVVKKWLKPLKVLRFDAGNLHIEAKDYFQALWFEEHVRSLANKELKNNNDRPVRVHLTIAKEFPNPSKTTTRRQVKEAPPKFLFPFDSLDPSLTFSTWAPIDSNSLPYKVFTELTGYNTEEDTFTPSEQKLGSLNPIYLYGPSGTGKTHLLLATAQALQQQGLIVTYCRAETFTDHVVRAIRSGEMGHFRKQYRSADALIFDDVHLLAKKKATQEEFFHTFNALHLSGKQIILSATIPPHELKEIEPRLISRFQWGVTLPLQPAEKESYGAILSKKTEALAFPLHKKVADCLIKHFQRSPKSLACAIEALILRCHMKSSNQPLSSTTLTPRVVEDLLRDLIEEEKTKVLTPKGILFAVAKYYGIQSDDICGKSQKRECVIPRHVAIYLCRKKLGLSLPKIGDLLSRDHTTILASLKKIDLAFKNADRDIIGPLYTINASLDHQGRSN